MTSRQHQTDPRRHTTAWQRGTYQQTTGRGPARRLPSTPQTPPPSSRRGRWQPADDAAVETGVDEALDDESDEEDEVAYAQTRLPRSGLPYRPTHTQTHSHTQPSDAATIVPARASQPSPNRGLMRYPAPEPELRVPRRRRHPHWLLYVGLGFFIMVLGWILLGAVSSWWQTTWDGWHYGYPRTYQTDAVVGHNDSVTNPSHFITINLRSHIEIIEFPGGDATKARVYVGPTLIGQGQDLASVTLTFKDVNGDGKPDMIVSVGENTFVYINDTGQFRPARPGEQLNL